MSKIRFDGDGPYDLPVAQQISAVAQDDFVILTFRVLADPSRLASVRIAIPHTQALEAAGKMAEQAALARSQRDKRDT